MNQTTTQLITKITHYNKLYRDGNPAISDKEYDALIEELRSLDPDNDWFKKIEPVTVEGSRKVKLPIPMKSLNKVKSISDLQAWFNSLGLKENTKLVITPKFDGISLLHDEILDKAYSRGGVENEGQDCSSHFQKLTFSVNTTQELNAMYTYGELVFNKENWEREFAGKLDPITQERIYKSPRNTVAGFINRIEPCDQLKYVDFFRYGVDEVSLSEYTSYTALFNALCYRFNQERLCVTTTVKELSESYLLSLYRDFNLRYYIDGLVIYIDDLNLWHIIGRNQTTGNPLYAMAYKHPDFTDIFETTVLDVVWKASKSRALKPVVKIAPVDVGDCQMENPTGYNARWILNNNITKGARILVTRSGGVIPKILESLEPKHDIDCLVTADSWLSTLVCPHCGSTLCWNETGSDLLCCNTNCDGVQLAKIIFFFSTVGVTDMGEETFAKLYEAGFKTIPAILNLTAQDILSIDGFGDSTATAILQNMQRIKSGVELPVLMQASDCFKGIGKIKASSFLELLSDDELKQFCNGTFLHVDTQAIAAKTIGKTITMQNIYAGYCNFMYLLQETKIPYIYEKSQAPITDGKCSGMVVCFSGFRDTELEKKIISEGGRVVSSVTKKTTHLIVKDITTVSSKLNKAQFLGVRIVELADLSI